MLKLSFLVGAAVKKSVWESLSNNNVLCVWTNAYTHLDLKTCYKAHVLSTVSVDYSLNIIIQEEVEHLKFPNTLHK